jgi:hypothetical protein
MNVSSPDKYVGTKYKYVKLIVDAKYSPLLLPCNVGKVFEVIRRTPHGEFFSTLCLESRTALGNTTEISHYNVTTRFLNDSVRLGHFIPYYELPEIKSKYKL